MDAAREYYDNVTKTIYSLVSRTETTATFQHRNGDTLILAEKGIRARLRAELSNL